MADEINIIVRVKDEFSSTLGNFGNIMTGIKSTIDLVSDGFRMFAGVAMQGLDAIASYERMAASLETLAAKEMLATGEASNMNEALRLASPLAEELLKWNQELAIKSPFTAEGVNNAFRMAQAYGFTIEEAKRLTQALIDFAAGSGASEAAMEAIARALGQISATGKVTGGDMLQLVNAGLPVVEILAEGFGVTTAELMRMRSEGLLPATEAIEYITQYLETNFAGAAERQATTWAGLQGTFADLKTMGLREFFGGLFEALQPVAIELSNFLQTEGMERLSEWGEKIGLFTKAIVDLVMGNSLYDLGAQLQDLGDKGSILEGLGTSLRVFQQAIDDGATNRDAFLLALEKFEQLTSVSIDKQFLVNFLFDFDAASLGELISKMDEAIALNIRQGIANGEFRTSGSAFGEALESIFSTGLEGDGSQAAPAIARAISQWFLGAMNISNWGEFLPTLGYAISNLLSKSFEFIGEGFWSLFAKVLFGEDIDTFFAGVQGGFERIKQFMNDAMYWIFDGVGEFLVEGLISGINSITTKLDQWAWDNIVMPIRRILGIASPSSVFADIGRNIVDGLIQGVAGMWSAFTSFIQTKFNDLLSNLSFENILAVLTGDMTLSELFGGSSSGSNQPYSPGGYGPGGYVPPEDSGGGISGSVVYNFYGPVYVRTEEDMEMFCPSPHPLISSSGNTLQTSGIG